MISVLVTNKNYGKYINQCIESILSQTVKPDEILVCDDNSTDTSVKKLRKFGDKIKVLYNGRNRGVAWGRNELVVQAKGDLCLFVDSDDILEDNYIENQLITMKSNPSASIVYSDWHEFGEHSIRMV